MCVSRIYEQQDQSDMDRYGGYDSDDSDDTDFECENLFLDDLEHLDMDKENSKYFIGSYASNNYRNVYLLTNSISAKSFMKYSFVTIQNYLYHYSVIKPVCMENGPKVEIMKIKLLADMTLSVVLKTFWLRIIQRRWKHIFNQRQEILMKRARLSSLFYFQVHGKYPVELNRLPTIYGMLSTY
jgi:hypothetical protein